MTPDFSTKEKIDQWYENAIAGILDAGLQISLKKPKPRSGDMEDHTYITAITAASTRVGRVRDDLYLKLGIPNQVAEDVNVYHKLYTDYIENKSNIPAVKIKSLEEFTAFIENEVGLDRESQLDGCKGLLMGLSMMKKNYAAYVGKVFQQ